MVDIDPPIYWNFRKLVGYEHELEFSKMTIFLGVFLSTWRIGPHDGQIRG